MSEDDDFPDLFSIGLYDALSKRVSSSNTLSKDDFVKLLLIIHDSLHDMCDKGDQLTITLLQD